MITIALTDAERKALHYERPVHFLVFDGLPSPNLLDSSLWRGFDFLFIVMNHLGRTEWRLAACLFLGAGLLTRVWQAVLARETALDRYIAKPDPSYAWKRVNTM